MDKGHILDEIRRTAQTNGGAPLGWRRFFSETGIRESDWLGKYWARWSEAVEEAGYAPNRLQPAYEASRLFQAYADLALTLGRLPKRGDLLLKSRNDSAFPNPKTFARLGGKAELVSRLAEYCRERLEYAAVSQYCVEYADRPVDRVSRSSDVAPEVGFVYLLKSGQFYKIGKTNAAGRRERELAIQLPEKANTVHVIKTDDPSGIEQYWHKRFEAKRKHGEWFALDSRDVSTFKRRKFM